MRRAEVVVVVLVASCGRYRFDPLGDAADACAAERVELGPWSPPTPLVALNSSAGYCVIGASTASPRHART